MIYFECSATQRNETVDQLPSYIIDNHNTCAILKQEIDIKNTVIQDLHLKNFNSVTIKSRMRETRRKLMKTTAEYVELQWQQTKKEAAAVNNSASESGDLFSIFITVVILYILFTNMFIVNK